MIAATQPIQRPPHRRLLVVDAVGTLEHTERSEIVEHLRADDLVVANDAATIPASLFGVHGPSGDEIEVRLAGRRSLSFDDLSEIVAVVFGRGDHRTPTERRPLPPDLNVGDTLELGPLRARVLATLGHQRLVRLAFDGSPEEVWAGIARHGRPIQYAHVEERLALWDVWTRVAARPVAFEPPSAGFLLDWKLLGRLRRRGVRFATLTHAAGISSTGDPALDRRLPFDEPYRIPEATVREIDRARSRGGGIVALGTTVTRALEHAAMRSPLAAIPLAAGPRIAGRLASRRVVAGLGVATQRIGPDTELQVVDAIVSGVHEPGTSHHELLRAFVGDPLLRRIDAALSEHDYRTHEFGDSVWIQRQRPWSRNGSIWPIRSDVGWRRHLVR